MKKNKTLFQFIEGSDIVKEGLERPKVSNIDKTKGNIANLEWRKTRKLFSTYINIYMKICWTMQQDKRNIKTTLFIFYLQSIMILGERMECIYIEANMVKERRKTLTQTLKDKWKDQDEG